MKKFSRYPAYLLFLPLFFVMHGLNENFGLVPVKSVIILFLLYLGACAMLFTLVWLFYRDPARAGLFSFALMAYFFFFGSMHDFMKKITNEGFFSRYTFILPVSILLFIILAVYLKKRKSSFRKTAVYLNFLFMILVVMETGTLIYKLSTEKKQVVTSVKGLDPCENCPKPDIYLIISDSYPGKKELIDKFGFDNSGFENSLAARGFHVVDSSISNYNSTPFSMASMLNLSYLEGIEGSFANKNDLNICYSTLRKASIFPFLESLGYRIYNYSIFDVDNEPSPVKPTIVPGKTSLITAQTFFKRIEKELGHNLVSRLNLRFVKEWVVNKNLKNNNKLIKLTRKSAGTKKEAPRFVYTHLMMPHYYYYFDSTGRKTPLEALTSKHYSDLNAFVSYLVYSNNRFLELIDNIQEATQSKAIIILASDHGFREFATPVEKPYYFMNLSSIYLPDGNYQAFYKGMSNVNLLRAVLNTQFKQQLPMLKDSTSYIRD